MMVANRKRADKRDRIDWMEVWNHITTFILLNMLWLFSALLVVTLPAATAALFAGVSSWTNGELPHKPIATFAHNMRRYWLKATAIILLNSACVALITINLFLLPHLIALRIIVASVTMLAAAVVLLVNVYLWPLLVTQDQPLRVLLTNALRLAFAHPLNGAGVALLAALPIVGSILLPGFFLLTCTGAGTALLVQWGAWRIIRRYVNLEERITE